MKLFRIGHEAKVAKSNDVSFEFIDMDRLLRLLGNNTLNNWRKHVKGKFETHF